MKLAIILLTAAALQVSAKGKAQNITLSQKDAPLTLVFKEIERQSGYQFFYNDKLIQNARKVTIQVNNATLQQTLDQCFKDQPLTWSLVDKIIVVKEKTINDGHENNGIDKLPPPIEVKGRVVNENGEPVIATVTVKGTKNAVSTDANGFFVLKDVDENAILLISGVNIEAFEVRVGGKTDLATLNVRMKVTESEEVLINTGYQKYKPNEMVGSATIVNKETLNKTVSTDILTRLEGVASGVLFLSGSEFRGYNQRGNILIRSISTIFSGRTPLIVLDDFPYDGDIASINPNDVESVTILKDAAAASIWGTRAANGVIVITTKKGKFNQKPKVYFNSSIVQKDEPDIFRAPTIGPSDYIDIETFLFNKGAYTGAISSPGRPALTPAVEILLKRQNGLISASDSAAFLNALRNIDVKKDLKKYYFLKPFQHQFSIGLQGGSNTQKYYLSVGYNRDINDINNYKRLSINAENTHSLLGGRLEVSTGIWFTHGLSKRFSSRYAFNYAYGQLADTDGNPVPIARYRQGYIDTAGGGKLLDWKYYPLREQDFTNSTQEQVNYTINAGLKYFISKELNVELKYRYGKQDLDLNDYASLETFYVRDLINSFTNLNQTNPNLRNPVPIGGILDKGESVYISHYVRGQVNYSKIIKVNHILSGMVGGELSDGTTEGSKFRTYGYDPGTGNNIPVDYVTSFPAYIVGNRNIPNVDGFSGATNRSVSVYASGSYSLRSKYTFYANARRDGANIYGATTNNKWKPLWSVGGKWDVDREPFFKIDWLATLKLRTTYGYQGNANNQVTALLTILLPSNLDRWRLPVAIIRDVPNPNLRWERVNNLNIALDFGLKSGRISGSVEYYRRKAMDLIGDKDLPPSSGISSTRANTANMSGEGIDLVLNSTNFDGLLSWKTTFMFSYARDEVTQYNLPVNNIGSYVQGSINPIVGRPVSAIYSYRWAGLDPATGDPQGILKGQVSKNYVELTTSKDVSEMVYHGPSVPPFFGSMLNSVSWKNLSLFINVTYKLGYYFRKPSINYSTLFSGTPGNNDYTKRWQKPGDEQFTNVPSMTYPGNLNRDLFYNYSEILVERADNIRLQNVRLSYTLNQIEFKKLPFASMGIYVSLQNLGIIWKANDSNIDPDYLPMNEYTWGLPGKTVAVGLTIDF